MRFFMGAWLALLMLAPAAAAAGQGKSQAAATPEKSAYYAFVDREFIFTLEMVSPGIPLVNFVSMIDTDNVLSAKMVRLTLENRKVPGQSFLIDTGDPKEPMAVPSLTMHARSSFGARLRGEFAQESELLGVTLRVGKEDFMLQAMTSLAFENLVLKVNRINLVSPDFRDDWHALKLELVGSRSPAPRRQALNLPDYDSSPQARK